MTIHKQKNAFYFECDNCADVLETGERDFQSSLDHLKREGWVAKKDGSGEWEHNCPKCG